MSYQHSLGFNGVSSSYIDASRSFLSENYRDLPNESVAFLLKETIDNLPPAQQDAFARLSLQNAGENFFQDIGRGLGQLGQSVARALPAVARVAAPIAQVALPAIGTMIGGPFGTMAGTALGGLVGNLAGRPPSPQVRPTAAGTMGGPAMQSPAMPAFQPQQTMQAVPQQQPTNPAAGQLMSLLSNPQLLQAILGQVMGPMGISGATVTSPQGQQSNIPFGALMNSVSELALRAAEESIRFGDMESESYLMDSFGGYRINDPSDPSQRADAVLEMLEQDSYHPNGYPDSANESYNDIGEWFMAAGMVR